MGYLHFLIIDGMYVSIIDGIIGYSKASIRELIVFLGSSWITKDMGGAAETSKCQ